MEADTLFMPQIKMACTIIETPYTDLYKMQLPGVKVMFGKKSERTVVELRDSVATLSCVYDELLHCKYVLIFPDINEIPADMSITQINDYTVKYHEEKGLIFLSVTRN